ncbi:unnamed protein product [Blepharisma stoltei]|uniref:Uncharacterized protein n=1 Tax=Blepharisma stoltei TaxID=1481888 RepID=A0AAU9JHU2_9CILI|nr:unnamed protein product [Blepharisma stoltei]
MLSSSLTPKTQNYISRKSKILEKYKEPLSVFRSRRLEEFAKHKRKLAQQEQTEMRLKNLIKKNTISEAMKVRNKKCEESQKKKEKAEKRLKRIENWEKIAKENNEKINEADTIFKMLLSKISKYEQSIFSWFIILINDEVYWQLFSKIEAAKIIRSEASSEIKTKTEELVPEYLRWKESFIKKGMNEILAEEEAQKKIEASKKDYNNDIKEAKKIFNEFNSITKTKQAEANMFIARAKFFWAKKKENIEEAKRKMLKALKFSP